MHVTCVHVHVKPEAVGGLIAAIHSKNHVNSVQEPGKSALRRAPGTRADPTLLHDLRGPHPVPRTWRPHKATAHCRSGATPWRT